MAHTIELHIYMALLVTFAAATISILGRMVSRRLLKVGLWWDDYHALIAYFFAVIWLALIIRWIQEGLGDKLASIPLPQEEALRRSRMLLYFVELTYAASLAFSKFAILMFYWRLFKTSTIRVPIQVLFGASVIWLILRTFIAIFHCIPVQAFWDYTIPGAFCTIDDSKFFFGTTLAHLVIDVGILLLPVMEVRKLQLPLKRKMAVATLFLFGIFVCVASVVVLDESARFDTSSVEMPFNVAGIMVWASVEVNLSVVSACLPMLRPVFRTLFCCIPASSALDSASRKNSNTKYSLSQPAGSKAIKLGTMSQHQTHNRTGRGNVKDIGDENDSTYQLADSVERGSDAGSFDGHPADAAPTTTGIHTYISGRECATGTAPEHAEGIMVKSEMSVRVSQTGERDARF